MSNKKTSKSLNTNLIEKNKLKSKHYNDLNSLEINLANEKSNLLSKNLSLNTKNTSCFLNKESLYNSQKSTLFSKRNYSKFLKNNSNIFNKNDNHKNYLKLKNNKYTNFTNFKDNKLQKYENNNLSLSININLSNKKISLDTGLIKNQQIFDKNYSNINSLLESISMSLKNNYNKSNYIELTAFHSGYYLRFFINKKNKTSTQMSEKEIIAKEYFSKIQKVQLKMDKIQNKNIKNVKSLRKSKSLTKLLSKKVKKFNKCNINNNKIFYDLKIMFNLFFIENNNQILYSDFCKTNPKIQEIIFCFMFGKTYLKNLEPTLKKQYFDTRIIPKIKTIIISIFILVVINVGTEEFVKNNNEILNKLKKESGFKNHRLLYLFYCLINIEDKLGICVKTHLRIYQKHIERGLQISRKTFEYLAQSPIFLETWESCIKNKIIINYFIKKSMNAMNNLKKHWNKLIKKKLSANIILDKILLKLLNKKVTLLYPIKSIDHYVNKIQNEIVQINKKDL